MVQGLSGTVKFPDGNRWICAARLSSNTFSAAELGFSGWAPWPLFAVLRGKTGGGDQPVSLQRLKEAIPHRDVCTRWRSCLQLLFRAKVPANNSGVIFP